MDSPRPVSGVASTPPQRNLLQMMLRRWWLVAGSIVICVVFAGVRSVTQTPIYRSTSTLYLTGSHLGADDRSNRAGPNLVVQAEVIKSTEIALTALNLPAAGTKPSLRTLKTLSGANALGALKGGIRTAISKEEYLSVSFETPNPQDAPIIVNRVVEAYGIFNEKQNASSASSDLETIRKAQLEADRDAQQKSQRMVEFLKANSMVNFTKEGNTLAYERLREADNALAAADEETRLTVALYISLEQQLLADPAATERVKEAQREMSPAITPLQAEMQYRAALQQATERMTELQAKGLGSSHPAVRQQQSQIDRLNAFYFVAVKNHLVAAQQRQKDMRAAYDKRQQDALAVATMAEQYDRLKSERDRAEASARSYSEMMRGVKFTGEIPRITINQIEPAADVEKVRPNRPLLLFQGFMIGAILGVGLTFLDRRYRSADEVTASLGLPILGTIPHVQSNQGDAVRGRAVHIDPSSFVAEAYRSVRTSLYFGSPDEEAKSVLITSPTQGDGKTTLTSNLGIAMAQAGQRTLIIDGDFRRPSQHHIFQVDGSNGLSLVLKGRATLDQAIQRSGIKNLDILPAGPIPPNPSEILNSHEFEQLLIDLAARYDQVLVDSPPVMPVTDARILSAMCDLTLMVIRADKSSRRLAVHARDGLLSVGANLVGTIINDIPRSSRYGAYGGYGAYYYRYGEEKAEPAGALKKVSL